ncbi:hypothetical protein [Nonomuraea longicatena]|uniref:Integral membrane protein n=1 Tax=Nonomuraea longicatena TaxID=83682 RepID=A0ABP4B3I1_9ACTN
MNLLEQRYRFVLRLLPRWYRAEREEEMVTAYLEYAGEPDDAVGARPPWGEVASIAGLSLRLRLGSRARVLAWGDTVRLIALIGLFISAADGLSGLLSWAAVPLFGTDPDLTPQTLVVTAVSAISVSAYVALVRGRVLLAKVCATGVLLHPVAEALTAFPAPGDAPTPSGYLPAIPALVPVAALYLGYRKGRRAPHVPWWALPLGAALLTGLGLGITGLALAGLADLSVFQVLLLISGSWTIVIAIVVAAVVCAVRRSSAAPLLALSVVAATYLASLTPELFRDSFSHPLIVVLGATVITTAIAGWRRLPAARPIEVATG